MFNLRNLLALAFIVSAILIVQPANAVPVVGIAVGAIGDDPNSNSVGSTEFRSALGGNAIEYYIPLGDDSGTYGVSGFGTASDTGNGGGTLSMILAFKPITPTSNGLLSILFEDLDLIGASDPANFLESVEVFNQNGDSVVGLIDNITPLLTGNAITTQLLSLAIGSLSGNVDTYYVQLDFLAALSVGNGTNTPEYLIATIDQIPPVPIPAALPLFGTGLAILGFFSWRRKRQRQA